MLNTLIREDSTFVESTQENRANLYSWAQNLIDLNAVVAEGSKGFDRFETVCGKIANSLTQEKDEDGNNVGVNVADLKSFVNSVMADGAPSIKAKLDERAEEEKKAAAAAEEN